MKVVDMHCDTISELLAKKRKGQHMGLRENNLHVDLQGMAKSGYLLQNFALFVNLSGGIPSGEPLSQEEPFDPWEEVCALHRLYQEEMDKNSDLIAPVLDFTDIQANEAAGKMSAMLTVEEGGVCRGEIGKLKELYGMGVRMMTLTWNHPNELGFPNLNTAEGKKVWEMCHRVKDMVQAGQGTDGAFVEMEKVRAKAQSAFEAYFCTPDVKSGLTERGREFVACMEEMGMIVDVSHLSDAGFYDVLHCTTKPFVASHSNARSVCPCVRNLTDDMIRKLADRGGCMGLNYCADFLKMVPVGQGNPGDIESIVEHARHITAVGGMEVLGLGSDFDGIDTHEELPGAQYMERLWDGLKKGGFRERELDQIFYGNVLRVYRDCL